MALIGLKDRIKGVKTAPHHGGGNGGGGQQGDASNASTVAIQQFLLNNHLPIGRHNETVPDGGFGPITNKSLVDLVSRTDITDPVLKKTIEAIKPFITSTSAGTSQKLPEIANLITGGGEARLKGQIDKPTETYDVDIDLGPDRPKTFPIAYAIVGKKNLEYTLAQYKFLNLNGTSTEKRDQVNEAVQLITSRLPNTAMMNGVKDALRYRAQELMTDYEATAAKPGIIQFLRDRYATDMIWCQPETPQADALAAAIYAMYPDRPVITDRTSKAQIVDMGQLSTMITQIHSQILQMKSQYGGK